MREMTKLQKLCIRWLNENFNYMEPFCMEKYPDYIFHMKNGKCILQHNKKNGYVYVSYRQIWMFFEDFFGMDNQQIKDITKIWFEKHHKMGVTTDVGCNSVFYNMVEEHYKMRVTTTLTPLTSTRSVVEEHYKMRVTTTANSLLYQQSIVEEHYQEIQTTDNQLEFYYEKDVEELYEQNTNG